MKSKSKIILFTLVFLGGMILLAIFAPWVTPYSFEEQNILHKLQGPSFNHWMGTDTLGRDLYSRIIYGARMSLAIGIFSALFALVVGTIIGGVAGFLGGWVDFLFIQLTDFLSIFPSALLAILIMLLLGRGFTGIFIALGITAWVTHARLVRSQVLQAREFAYVEAARALGVSPFLILFRHIIPNLWGPMIVSLTLQIPNLIMSESFLSFVGLGLQPPYSSWGTLANEGFRAMQSYPHLILFPGGVLFLTLMAFGFLGDYVGLKSK